MGFAVFQERDGARPIVVAQGDVDVATADELTAAIGRARAEGDEVWVDLTDVEFMDSTGITALLTGNREGALVIICPPGPARRVLEISGVDGVLRLRDDRGSAAQA
jgi:anti-anti-sigma factor